jgi:hypothetical protein
VSTCVIVQSSYLPWRGYFDLIDRADCFVFLDGVQFTRRDWRTRNFIRTQNGGSLCLSVPVHAPDHQNLKISEVSIDYSQAWVKRHLRSMSQGYSQSPHRDLVMASLAQVYDQNILGLAALNRKLIQTCWDLLSEAKPKVFVGDETLDIPDSLTKTARIVEICRRLGVNRYLSGPTARDYIEPTAFAQAGICLEYADYNFVEYPQIHGGFDPFVSVVDTLMNLGPGCLNRALLKIPQPRVSQPIMAAYSPGSISTRP